LEAGGAQWTKVVFQLQQEVLRQVEVMGMGALAEYGAVFGGRDATLSNTTGIAPAASTAPAAITSSISSHLIGQGGGAGIADGNSSDGVAAFEQLLAELPQVLRSVEKDAAAAEVAEMLLGLFQGEFKRGYGDVASFMQGHLYYCPEGHPYVIGECGGAMQMSRCPECGAAIGGGSHRLAVGNRGADAATLAPLQERWIDSSVSR
jgi:hypothetical protein